MGTLGGIGELAREAIGSQPKPQVGPPTPAAQPAIEERRGPFELPPQ